MEEKIATGDDHIDVLNIYIFLYIEKKNCVITYSFRYYLRKTIKHKIQKHQLLWLFECCFNSDLCRQIYSH